jgi:hypothetical protein
MKTRGLGEAGIATRTQIVKKLKKGLSGLHIFCLALALGKI